MAQETEKRSVTVGGEVLEYDPKDLKASMALIEKLKGGIAERRDALREMHEEIESVLTSVDEGLDELDRALDTLSQFV